MKKYAWLILMLAALLRGAQLWAQSDAGFLEALTVGNDDLIGSDQADAGFLE